MSRLAEQLRRFAAFLREDLWTAEFEPRSWPARALALLRFVVMVGEGFVRDQLLLRASALSYFTVLAIVPVLAIVSSVMTALGVTENVVGPILDQFARVSPQVAEQLRDLLSNANVAGLGTVGAVTLFLTSVLGITNVERALNHIWGVKQERPLVRRLPDYVAVLIVAPLLLGVGLSLGASIKSPWVVQRLVQFPAFELAYHLGLRQLPVLVLAAAFGFLYWFMPNTTVRPFAALLGGAVAALGVHAALAVYVGFSVGAARANALYGGFAALPLFFVWVYFFWAIVLFGAEIAFAYQNLKLYVREVRGERAGPAEREAIGLRIVLEIARAFRDGCSPWTPDELSDTLRVPARTVRDVLAGLQRAGIVAALDAGEKQHAYQLGRPAERIQVVDVRGALRGPREPGAGETEVRLIVEKLLAELAEGEAKAAAGRSLADLLERIPADSVARGS